MTEASKIEVVCADCGHRPQNGITPCIKCGGTNFKVEGKNDD